MYIYIYIHIYIYIYICRVNQEQTSAAARTAPSSIKEVPIRGRFSNSSIDYCVTTLTKLLNKRICLCVVSVYLACMLLCENLVYIFPLWPSSSLYLPTKINRGELAQLNVH